MSREGALFKNTMILTIGKICTQLISFLLLPIYTGVLSTEEFGLVDLLNTLVVLMIPLVTFQIEQALFRDLVVCRGKKDEQTEIITSTFLFVIFQCVVGLFIFLIASVFINNEYKYYLAITIVLTIFSSMFLQVARGLGYNIVYSIASFLSALSIILFNILFLVVFKLGARGILLGTIMGHVVCILYIFAVIKFYQYFNIKYYSNETLSKMLKYSMPLIPNAISWWIITASDRTIVASFLGIGSNGILSAASKFSAVFITIYNIFNISWTESIVLHKDDADIQDYFNKMFNLILKLFFSIGIMIITIMPFVYPVMINSKFSEGFKLVPILIVGSLFNIIVGLLSVIYIANKNTKAIANTSIFAATINLVTHLILIRQVGLIAAPLSSLISYLAMSIYRMNDVNKRYFKIKFNKELMFAFIIILPVIMTGYYIQNIYLNIMMLLFSSIYILVMNKSMMKQIYFKAKSILNL